MRFQASLLTIVTLALLATATPTIHQWVAPQTEELSDVIGELPTSGRIIYTAEEMMEDFVLEVASDDDVAILDDWKNEVVKQHNENRQHYGAGPLTWSDALYPGTLQWANNCKFQHR